MRAILLVLVAIVLASCCDSDDQATLRFSGNTMGTTYNVTIVGVPDGVTQAGLANAIKDALKRVNSQMSNWDTKSEISRFNQATTTTPVDISPELAHVMAGANRVHMLSQGRFDVTLGPLIDLWGFGAKQPGDPVPSDAEIAAALENVGQGRLLHFDPAARNLQKSIPGLEINLSAIAKGYGADAVATRLRSMGVENYLVEIGGDLVSSGVNDKGEEWRIGIERPDAGSQMIQMILPISEMGMATSGDYRNFFEQDGVRYSHIIDPRTGRPVTHRTTSVSVLAENAMMADALATAMLVLGQEAGLRIANDHGLAVFFISRAPAGSDAYFTTAESRAFETLRKTD